MTISILTCTYNAEKVLQRTLDSVAMQSYDHVQHVIVDGASKDATMELVRRYESENTRHTVLAVSERDNGLYDAMNKAIDLATGDYIVYLNAGDKLHGKDTLKNIADGVGETPYGVIYGNTDVVDDEGRYLGARRLQPPETLTWKSFKDGMLVCHQSFYARTEIARKVRYDNEHYRMSADVDWCIRIMKEAERHGLTMYNTHMILCDYLAGGMSVQNHRNSLIERFKIMTRHYGLITTIIKHITFLFRQK